MKTCEPSFVSEPLMETRPSATTRPFSSESILRSAVDAITVVIGYSAAASQSEGWRFPSNPATACSNAFSE